MKRAIGMFLAGLLVLASCSVTPPVTNQFEASGWANPGYGISAVVKTLGSPNDYSGVISLQSGDNAGAYGWWHEFSHTGYERPGDSTGFWPYATASQLPDAGRGFLRWRSIVPAYRADIFIPGDSSYFAIEYKDNLLSPRLDPRFPKEDGPTVVIGNIKLGELEAKRDHKWKRIVFAIPASAPREPDGRYRIKIGKGEYGQNEFYGSALVHRLIAAKSFIPTRTARAGFWPSTTRVLTNDDLFDRAGKKYVPVIVDIGFAQLDVNQIDALDLIGANTNLSVGSAEGSGRRSWAPNDFYFTENGRQNRMMGVPTNMTESKARGYYAVPWVYTDTWKYFIEHIGVDMTYGGPGYEELYNGTWRGVLRVWEKALTDVVKNNPNVPFIYLKDEWDHEANTWGSLEEQVLEMRAIANRVAPGVPTVITAMGWKPLMHKTSFELADIVFSDRYPPLNDLQEVAEWAEEMRRVSNGKPFLSVLALTNAYENVRDNPSLWNTVAYLRSGTYMSLIHGGKGIWWFGEPAGMLDQVGRDYYASLRPLARELRLLADVLHGSVTELGRTTASTRTINRLNEVAYPISYQNTGDGTSSRDGISTSYRQSSTRKVLLSVNEWNQRLNGVRLNVSGVRAGDVITVLFENRTIIADRDGSFIDNYAPYQRHVYQIP
jgi:hypothetical protein